ncbi:MAPEG family protein [Maliponia aquimaris]|uniref:MAPEG family protein n=1 Tax=Maliponia aquimaris TaxID=1673631 RepID=A0A238KWZ5_9RHOB|nr:MAPEG family protein [Maliponia aquimaris]SMX47218.1 MAPEG family protein [Maliponia aquimaris]
MTPELTALTLAALLQVLQYVLMSVPANRELGTGKTLSPRDGMNLQAELSPRTARLVRALNNHFEGLILFSIAVFVITFSDQGNGFTAAMSLLYLAARTLYIPAYYYGWTPWRSVIWMVGFVATALMLLAALA